jgi:hypothetical protein
MPSRLRDEPGTYQIASEFELEKAPPDGEGLFWFSPVAWWVPREDRDKKQAHQRSNPQR